MRQVKHPQRVVVVDFYERKWHDPRLDVVSVGVMPNTLQGKHRLTKDDWWNAAAARNTGLCHCPNDFICFVDDNSVPLPGWYDAILEAERGQYVVCGAYKKMKNLIVEDGVPTTFSEHSADGRLSHAKGLTTCGGEWLFGCSVAGPTRAFLQIGGWPEYLALGISFEDVLCGFMLKNAGYELKYNPAMMTYESEDHHNGKTFIRKNKGQDRGHDAKDYQALHKAQKSAHLDNPFWPMGIAALRDMILRGEPYPPLGGETRDWYDGTLISEMT